MTNTVYELFIPGKLTTHNEAIAAANVSRYVGNNTKKTNTAIVARAAEDHNRRLLPESPRISWDRTCVLLLLSRTCRRMR